MTCWRAYLLGVLTPTTVAFVLTRDSFLIAMWTLSIIVATVAGTWIGRARRITDDAAFLHYLNGGSGPKSIP